jgi:hypothetical protein
MGNCLLDLLAVFDLDLEPIWVDNSLVFFVSQQLELNTIMNLEILTRGTCLTTVIPAN